MFRSFSKSFNRQRQTFKSIVSKERTCSTLKTRKRLRMADCRLV